MPRLRLATWNVNSLKVRLPQVLDWLESAQIDALVLEETKVTDGAFPLEALQKAGFDAVFSGQRTYNGVALLTRKATLLAPESVERALPGYADSQRRFVSALLRHRDAPDTPIRFAGAYFPNGQAIGAQKFLYKLDWISVLTRHILGLLKETPRLVLGGDFNIVPSEADSWDPAHWEGGIFCSSTEREALGRLMSLGLIDAFRHFPQPAESFSWWDYRQAGFEKNHGLRIDLMLVSNALEKALTAAQIDRAPRAAAQPSDHAPVTIDLELV